MSALGYEDAVTLLRGLVFVFAATTLLCGFCLGDVVGRMCARRDMNLAMESSLRLHREMAQQHRHDTSCRHDTDSAVAWDKGLEDRIKKILETEVDDKGNDTFVIKTG